MSPLDNSQLTIGLSDFQRVEMCVGTIRSARENPRAKKPAHVLEIDFGPLGMRTSSAQITEHYSPESLLGRQIVAVMNFPPKCIAGVTSEVLVLAAIGKGGTILLSPTDPVENGARIT